MVYVLHVVGGVKKTPQERPGMRCEQQMLYQLPQVLSTRQHSWIEMICSRLYRSVRLSVRPSVAVMLFLVRLGISPRSLSFRRSVIQTQPCVSLCVNPRRLWHVMAADSEAVNVTPWTSIRERSFMLHSTRNRWLPRRVYPDNRLQRYKPYSTTLWTKTVRYAHYDQRRSQYRAFIYTLWSIFLKSS